MSGAFCSDLLDGRTGHHDNDLTRTSTGQVAAPQEDWQSENPSWETDNDLHQQFILASTPKSREVDIRGVIRHHSVPPHEQCHCYERQHRATTPPTRTSTATAIWHFLVTSCASELHHGPSGCLGHCAALLVLTDGGLSSRVTKFPCRVRDLCASGLR